MTDVEAELSPDLDLAFLVCGLEARDELRLMSGEGLTSRTSDLCLRLRDGLYTRGSPEVVVVFVWSWPPVGSSSKCCHTHANET